MEKEQSASKNYVIQISELHLQTEETSLKLESYITQEKKFEEVKNLNYHLKEKIQEITKKMSLFIDQFAEK